MRRLAGNCIFEVSDEIRFGGGSSEVAVTFKWNIMGMNKLIQVSEKPLCSCCLSFKGAYGYKGLSGFRERKIRNFLLDIQFPMKVS